jgi:hypothetical protein
MELTTEAHISSLLNGIFGVHYFNPGFLIRESQRESLSDTRADEEEPARS